MRKLPTIADDLQNIEDLIKNSQGLVQSVKDEMDYMREIAKIANMIGGSCNVKLRSVITDEEFNNVRDLSEMEFMSALQSKEVVSDEPVTILVSYGKLCGKIQKEIEYAKNKYDKVRERARTQKSGAEHAIALNMRDSWKTAMEVLSGRKRYATIRMIGLIAKILTVCLRGLRSVRVLYPDGDEAIRTAFVENNVIGIVSETLTMCNNFILGRVTKKGAHI